MALIERVDRMQLAVRERAVAEETFQRLFGAERVRLKERVRPPPPARGS